MRRLIVRGLAGYSLGIAILAFRCEPALCAAPSAGSVAEYEAKAAFLYNLVKFVEWPTDAIAPGPFRMCVAEPDPFGESLPLLVRNRQVFGFPVEIIRIRGSEPLKSCHALFISTREPRRAASLLREIQGAPVLTVGETIEFGQTGGMMTLLIMDGRIELSINTDAVRASNLGVSAQLLRLAQRGKDGGKR